jgi:hypothetical protein
LLTLAGLARAVLVSTRFVTTWLLPVRLVAT